MAFVRSLDIWDLAFGETMIVLQSLSNYCDRTPLTLDANHLYKRRFSWTTSIREVFPRIITIREWFSIKMVSKYSKIPSKYYQDTTKYEKILSKYHQSTIKNTNSATLYKCGSLFSTKYFYSKMLYFDSILQYFDSVMIVFLSIRTCTG